MKDRNEQTDIRLAIIGAPNVGKSAIAVRFLTRRFIGEYEADMEFVFKREMRFEDDLITYELKDTAGRTCVSEALSILNWASAIVVVYSMVERSSFVTASTVLEELKRLTCAPYDLVKISPPALTILANKQDMSHRREVTVEEGRNLALRNGASFYEVSAAQDYDNIFIPLNQLIVQRYIRATKEALSEEQSHNIDKRTHLQLPLIEETPGYERNAPGKRKQTVRRKISAAIFKKRSETV